MNEEFLPREDKEFFKIRFLKKYILGTNGIIAGGCFKNIFNNEKIKDIDIFFRDSIDFSKAVVKYKNNKHFKLIYDNKNVTAFKEDSTNINVELIKKTFGTPDGIISNFDFSITKFAYYYEIDYDEDDNITSNYYVIHHEKFFEHLIDKRLVLNKKILYPFNTFERALKYKGYGYSLCRESKVNLIEAIRKEETFNNDDLSKSLYKGVD